MQRTIRKKAKFLILAIPRAKQYPWMAMWSSFTLGNFSRFFFCNWIFSNIGSFSVDQHFEHQKSVEKSKKIMLKQWNLRITNTYETKLRVSTIQMFPLVIKMDLFGTSYYHYYWYGNFWWLKHITRRTIEIM